MQLIHAHAHTLQHEKGHQDRATKSHPPATPHLHEQFTQQPHKAQPAYRLECEPRHSSPRLLQANPRIPESVAQKSSEISCARNSRAGSGAANTCHPEGIYIVHSCTLHTYPTLLYCFIIVLVVFTIQSTRALAVGTKIRQVGARSEKIYVSSPALPT